MLIWKAILKYRRMAEIIFHVLYTLKVLVLRIVAYFCFSKWWQQKKAEYSHCPGWEPAYCVLGESTHFFLAYFSPKSWLQFSYNNIHSLRHRKFYSRVVCVKTRTSEVRASEGFCHNQRVNKTPYKALSMSWAVYYTKQENFHWTSFRNAN